MYVNLFMYVHLCMQNILVIYIIITILINNDIEQSKIIEINQRIKRITQLMARNISPSFMLNEIEFF